MPSAINLTGPLGPEQYRNKLINGDFNFWQRGTSNTFGPDSGYAAGTMSVSEYAADRWHTNSGLGKGFSGESPSGSIASIPRISTKRQGFTLGYPSLSGVQGSQYFHRVTIGAADGTGVIGITGACMDMGNSYIQLSQHTESGDLGEWSGKTCWLSFLAKSFGDISSPTIGCRIDIIPDISQTITTGPGGVPGDVCTDTTGVTASITYGTFRQSRIVGDDIELTGQWQKFKRKFILPSFAGFTLGTDGVASVRPVFVLSSGKSGPGAFYSKSAVTDYLGLTGLTGAFDVAQVQLEIGDDTSSFEKRHPQIELSMCQRYYEKSYDVETAPGTSTNRGWIGLSDPSINPVCHHNTYYSIRKRAIPTVVLYDLDGTAGKIYVQHAADNYNNAIVAAAAENISESGFGKVVVEDAEGQGLALGTNPAGDTMINFHYTADAEL